MSSPDSPKPKLSAGERLALNTKNGIEGLIQGIASTSERSVREALSLIIQIGEGIEAAEIRDPLFAEKHVEDLHDTLNFYIREGLPKFIEYYAKRLEEQEHFLDADKENVNKDDPDSMKKIPERRERVKNLTDMIKELEGIIALKEEALKPEFGPLLERAKNVRRPLAIREMQDFEEQAKRIAKIEDLTYKKDKLQRLVSRVRKELQAVAEDDEHFQEYTFDPTLRRIDRVRGSAVDAIRKTITLEPPKAKRGKASKLAILALLLGGGVAAAHWKGVRPHNILNLLSDLRAALEPTKSQSSVDQGKKNTPDTPAPVGSGTTSTPNSSSTSVVASPATASIAPETSHQPSGVTAGQQREQEEPDREAQRLSIARERIRLVLSREKLGIETRLVSLREDLSKIMQRLEQWRSYTGPDQARRTENLERGERACGRKQAIIDECEQQIQVLDDVIGLSDNELIGALSRAEQSASNPLEVFRVELLRRMVSPRE